MNIVICDDDNSIYEEAEHCCSDIINEEIQFYTYGNGQLMLEQVPDVCKIDLFILDIEMPVINGIELRKRIERISPSSSVIYITNHEEYALDAYGRCVIGFVVKSHLTENLSNMLKQFYSEWKENIEISVKTVDGEITVKRNDIISISSDRVYSHMKIIDQTRSKTELSTKEICVRKSLNEWELILGNEEFFRIHKSSIINFKYVIKLDSEVALMDGTCLKIARSRKKETQLSYKNYCKKRARCV